MNVSHSDHNETYGDDSSSLTFTSASYVLLRTHWQEYEISYHIWITAGWFIIIIGSVSHALSLTVLLGNKRMRLLPLTVYLVANAVAGLATLYVGLLRWVIRFQFDVDLRNLTSTFSCGLHLTLTYMSLQLFSWLQAITAIDRTLAVCRPFGYQQWCRWRRNVTIVVSVVFLLGSVNAIFGSLSHIYTKGGCADFIEVQQELLVDVWGYVDLVLFSLLPISVIVPCNFLSLRTIYRSRTESRSSARKHIELTTMLIVQNCVFVATTLPTSILFLLPWPTEDDTAEGARRELEWTILTLLQYLGTTFGFFIYSTLGRRFRRSLAALFRKGCK